MQRLCINNRKGMCISVIVERPWFPRGTALVMHGLGATKEQAHVQACATPLKEFGYTTVRFDATNSFGESGGDFKDATVASYFEDLEDVIVWLRGQKWFKEPFVLAGHSLGAMCSAMYAEKNPSHVAAIVPMSLPVSGALLLDAVEKWYPAEIKHWRDTGEVKFGDNVPAFMKMMLPDNLESFLSYDLLPQVSEINMPSLFIVGETDWLTPPVNVQKFFDLVPGRKEMHIIHGAPHTFHDPVQTEQVTDLVTKWILTLGH